MYNKYHIVAGLIAVLSVFLLSLSFSLFKQVALSSDVEALPVSLEIESEVSSVECLTAGGKVGFDKVSECVANPDDKFCRDGSCYIEHDGYTCRDAKVMVCGCKSGGDCPAGYECRSDYGGKHCTKRLNSAKVF